ncbi:MAG: hypothetical protein ACKO7R_14770 [Pseudanabaena sp.]
MYTARIDSRRGENPQRPNPTNLGDGVLLLIKRVLNKQGNDNYRKAAKNFYEQIQNITFLEFKVRLLDYLGISHDDLEISEILRLTVVEKLKYFQEHRDEEIMPVGLLYATCYRVLQYLLLNERRKPSDFLKLSLEYDNFLNPIILLLKIVLILPHTRFYLESYIAELLKFYSVYDETECRSFINFLDVLNVTLAIFDEDTDYSLIKIKDVENDLVDINLDNCRIFSQLKRLADLDHKSVEQFERIDQEDTTKTLNF